MTTIGMKKLSKKFDKKTKKPGKFRVFCLKALGWQLPTFAQKNCTIIGHQVCKADAGRNEASASLSTEYQDEFKEDKSSFLPVANARENEVFIALPSVVKRHEGQFKEVNFFSRPHRCSGK